MSAPFLAIEDVADALRRACTRSPTSRLKSNAGRCVGLIGPNGSGKTTLMNVDLRRAAPDRRRGALQRNRASPTFPTHAVCRLGIARTFQVVKPFANLTVRENVAVGAMYGREGARRSTRARRSTHAEELLDFVGLAPRRRSAGQRSDDPRPQAPRSRESARARSRGAAARRGDGRAQRDRGRRRARAAARGNARGRHADRRRAPDESDRLDLGATIVVLAEGGRSPKARRPRCWPRRK